MAKRKKPAKKPKSPYYRAMLYAVRFRVDPPRDRHNWPHVNPDLSLSIVWAEGMCSPHSEVLIFDHATGRRIA